MAHGAGDLAHQIGEGALHPVDGRTQLTQFIAVEAAVTDPLLQFALTQIAIGNTLGLTGQHDQRVADLAGQYHGEHHHKDQTEHQRDGDTQIGGLIRVYNIAAGFRRITMVNLDKGGH